jgi:four helix bundle protein
MANRLEELRVYQDAMEFWSAVNAILERPAYRRDRKLADQTSEANDSIPANISEGFEQPSDASSANYLFHAKGSLGEVLTRLREARLKNYITPEELSQRLTQGEELSRSIAAFIRYLDGCGWKDRGRHKSRLRRSTADKPTDPTIVDRTKN